MIKKTRVKSGDIFEVNLEDNTKSYIQYIFQDSCYLSGHLIRAFKTKNLNNNLCEIMNEEILFYAYTRLTQGVELGYWSKLGNCPLEKKFEPPMFKSTPDSHKLKKSYNWKIFQSGSPDRVKIGELTDEYKKFWIDGVFAPIHICQWLQIGKYPYDLPE
jgi:hypothetical protein